MDELSAFMALLSELGDSQEKNEMEYVRYGTVGKCGGRGREHGGCGITQATTVGPGGWREVRGWLCRRLRLRVQMLGMADASVLREKNLALLGEDKESDLTE